MFNFKRQFLCDDRLKLKLNSPTVSWCGSPTVSSTIVPEIKHGGWAQRHVFLVTRLFTEPNMDTVSITVNWNLSLQ
jgi:hypothetical protein